jgi:hypothetical protein
MRPVALYRWTLLSDRPANRVQKTEKPVRDWSKFLTLQGADLYAVERRHSGPPPFLRLRSGSCSVYDVENVFQFSVAPVAIPK